MAGRHAVLGTAEEAATTGYVRVVQSCYALVATVFAACVAAQVFLAGLGVFAGPAGWVWHEEFVHLLQPLPLAMIALSFPGRLSLPFNPRTTYRAS
jgi:hypothetical protein